MVESHKYQNVPSLNVLAMTATRLNIAPQNDIQFLKDIKAPSATPEYSEHNIKLAQRSCRALQNAIKTMYLPLISKSPTEHSTIMKAVVKAMRLANETCQPYTTFSCDQQLYKILVDIKWAVMPDFLTLKLLICKVYFSIKY